MSLLSWVSNGVLFLGAHPSTQRCGSKGGGVVRSKTMVARTPGGSEHWHQSTFIAVIRKLPHPAGRITFAVPNGFLKSKASRIRAWKEGMVAGVLDVFNPTPCGGYHGHWIEFKIPGNRLSPEQVVFKESMERNGYRVDVVYSWREALEKWADYLKGSRMP